jgi:hypothetical protein
MNGCKVVKRILIIPFLLSFVFYAPGDAQPCPEGINHITDCPDEGCGDHPFDPELNKRKNIRSDDQQATLRSIRRVKGLPDPVNFTENGNRDELRQVGEGQKITVVAWVLTARKGSQSGSDSRVGLTCNHSLQPTAPLRHAFAVDFSYGAEKSCHLRLPEPWLSVGRYQHTYHCKSRRTQRLFREDWRSFLCC